MNARQMALGGVTAALAVVIMSLGGMVPAATYVLPLIVCILLALIAPRLGSRGVWVWYGAVSLLAVLLCPDKEAAWVFVFLGYYPIIKPHFDRFGLSFLIKFLYFNAATLLCYTLMLHLFAMEALAAEFAAMGLWLTVLTLLLGNVCFLLLDKALGLVRKKFGKAG